MGFYSLITSTWVVDQLVPWTPLLPTIIIITLVSLAFLTFILGFHKKLLTTMSSSSSSSWSRVPEPEGSWPIIGHLRYLIEPDLVPHETFSELADKCGPIYKIKLGVRNVLVVNSWELAKECLSSSSTSAKSFLTRPMTNAFELLGYSSAMFGISPYGTYWRETRKIATFQLLSHYRLEIMKPVRLSQFREGIKSLYGKWESGASSSSSLVFDKEYKLKIDLKEWLADIFLNGILQVINGKSLWVDMEKELGDQSKCSPADRYVKLVKEFVQLAGTFTVGDALPFLKFLDIGGHGKAMKEVSRELDRYSSLMLENHKRQRSEGMEKKQQDLDFMDIMLDYIESNPEIESFGYDKDTIIKATCLTLILAGAETSPVAMSWGFALLLNHPEVLKKAQNELDTIVGRDRQITEYDLPNLVYIQAIIKEFFRLYPAAPLSVPRIATDEVDVAGYRIPSGTWLYVNIYKIQRDPRIWENPNEFRPERFLNEAKNYDYKGTQFEFMPFSSGRRMCPGMPFTMQGISFLLPIMLHSFDMSRVSSDVLVDMKAGRGTSNVKVNPVDALLTPRLPPHLYQDIN